MATTEYKLSYTAAEINERLGNVSHLSENVGALQSDVGVIQTNVNVVQTDVGVLQTDIQNKAEIMTLSTSEYEALEETNANTLYMLTDAEEEVDASVLYTEQELTDEQKSQARANIEAQEKLTGAPDQIITFDENGNAIVQDTANSEDAIITLSELGFVSPAQQDGVIYTDPDGKVLII